MIGKKIIDLISNRFISDLFKEKPAEKHQNAITLDQKDGSSFQAKDIVGGNCYNYNTTINQIFPSGDQGGQQVEEFVNKLTSVISNPIVSSNEPALIPQKVSERISIVENLQKKRRFKDALNAYLDITTDHTLSDLLNNQARFTINNNIGICYFNLPQENKYLEKAKKHLDRAFELKNGQEDEKIFMTLSWYYREIGDLGEAHSYACRAVELKPDYVNALNILAIIRMDSGESPEDILKEIYFDEQGKLKNIFIDNHSAIDAVGQLYLRFDKYDEAIEYFKVSLEKDSTDL